METITCHDCSKPVAFSAKACPHCGSTEPTGPYRFSHKERRRHRIEERNDRNMILFAMVLGVIGAFYGAETSSSTFGSLFAGLVYGFVGVVIGVPLAFAVNVTRNWR